MFGGKGGGGLGGTVSYDKAAPELLRVWGMN